MQHVGGQILLPWILTVEGCEGPGAGVGREREGMDFGSLGTNSNILLFPNMEMKFLDFKVILTHLKKSNNIEVHKLETENPI